MATVVYQGFQSRLESQINEPMALRLRLSSPNPHFFQPFELALKSCILDSASEDTSKRNNNLLCNNIVSPRPDSTSLSFLQALSCDSPLSTPRFEKERTYFQRSPLSEKSLALCTENLGNETGSDITDNDVFTFASSDVEERETLSRQGLRSRKGNNVIPSFPPPLTSMRGSESIQLRPQREDGRLVLKATKEPPRNTCFQAERSNGRLRLSVLRDYEHRENEEEDEEETMEPESENEEVKSMENRIQRPGKCVEGDQDNMG